MVSFAGSAAGASVFAGAASAAGAAAGSAGFCSAGWGSSGFCSAGFDSSAGLSVEAAGALSKTSSVFKAVWHYRSSDIMKYAYLLRSLQPLERLALQVWFQ